MNIAIVTSGILPVPAVQGGAVENLIDFYLDYNHRHGLHQITVYSVADEKAMRHDACTSDVNHYHFIPVNSLGARIRKSIFRIVHRHLYYHYTIEYYFHCALKHIRRQHYDLIITENRPAYAIALRRASTARLLCHLHNDKLNSSTRLGADIIGALDAVVTVSHYIEQRVNTIPQAATKTITVNNGIALDAFAPTAPSAINRAQLGLDADNVVMVFSGRVTREKGIMELIQAMQQLDDCPTLRLLVIGSSFYGNADNRNPFAEKLKAEADTLKGRIIFTGFVPYSSMPDYLHIADIAVVPSVWDDPFPTTVLEAQAAALPVITTRRGGIPEEVTTGSAVIIDTDQHFISSLANAIRALYLHPEQRQRMATAALQQAARFDRESYAQQFIKACEGLVSTSCYSA